MRVRLSLAAAAVAGLILAGPPASIDATLLAATSRETMLAPVSWLAAHLHDPGLVILQVGDAAMYGREHVPGAQKAEMAQFAAAPGAATTGLTLELPDDKALRTTLESFGISDSSRIVIVESDEWFSPSTRIYLTLVHAGFGSNTALLDGGLKAWKAAGQPVTPDVPAIEKGTLSPLETVAVTVDSAYVRSHAATPGVVILDARSPEAWNGVQAVDSKEKPPRYGHIPGSRSLPLEELWDDATSALKPAADLEKRFAEAGVKPGDTVIGYCYIGQRATATLFAAATLGHPVKLYDGSMDEWSKLKLPLEMPRKGGGR